MIRKHTSFANEPLPIDKNIKGIGLSAKSYKIVGGFVKKRVKD